MKILFFFASLLLIQAAVSLTCVDFNGNFLV